MSVIRTQQLTKTFSGITAVNGLDLEVQKGEIFGLVGPDGAGKTTTMRLLTGIMEPTSGQGWVLNHSLRSEAEIIKENIGYMSQRFGLYPDLTVLENLTFYADIYCVEDNKRAEIFNKLLEFSHLNKFQERLAGHLSGGMKQKLGLACALVHKPEVLFLDEPTNGVDPVSRRDFWHILYQLNSENVTIFLSTAYLDEAERCTRVAFLNKGKLLACGTPHELKEQQKDFILEIRTNSARKAMMVLSRDDSPDHVRLFGSAVHLVVPSLEGAPESVRRKLEDNGLQVMGITSLEPSLEDVFISLLANQRVGV